MSVHEVMLSDAIVCGNAVVAQRSRDLVSRLLSGDVVVSIFLSRIPFEKALS